MWKKIDKFFIKYNPIVLLTKAQKKGNDKAYKWGTKNKKTIKETIDTFIVSSGMVFDIMSILFLILYAFLFMTNIARGLKSLILNGLILFHILILLVSTLFERAKYLKERYGKT